jgi:hypothetical protein
MRPNSALRLRLSRSLALALGFALVTSACGGGSSPEAGDGSGATASNGIEIASPLAQFFGFDSTEDDQARYADQERTRLEWVAACMADQGFEYHYPDPGDQQFSTDQSADGPEWGTREWAEIYGFGVSTQAFDQSVVGPDLVGTTSSVTTEYTDPNGEYIDSLSQQEQSAYWSALYGDDPGVEWDDSLTDAENEALVAAYYEDYVPTGCDSRSYDEFAGEDPFAAVWETYGDELSAIYERVEADPEMMAAVDEISRCVNAKGFAYSGDQGVYEDINTRMEEIWQSLDSSGPAAVSEEDVAVMSEEELASKNSQPDQLSEEGRAKLAELQDYEISFALAVYDCGGSELYPLYAKINARLEQQFIDAHRDELEALRG